MSLSEAPVRFLQDIRNRGIEITVEGESLRLHRASNLLTERDRERLREHKPALLEILRSEDQAQGVQSNLTPIVPRPNPTYAPPFSENDLSLEALTGWSVNSLLHLAADIDEAPDSIRNAWRPVIEGFWEDRRKRGYPCCRDCSRPLSAWGDRCRMCIGWVRPIESRGLTLTSLVPKRRNEVAA